MPGPTGAGHFVKMVHNGIEYGLMQAYAEGFDILRHANAEDLPAERRFDLNLGDIAEVWRRGSVVSSWLLDLTAQALAGDEQLTDFSGYVEDSRRGPLDHQRRHRGGRPGHGPLRRPLPPLPLPRARELRRQAALGDAQGLRRPPGAEGLSRLPGPSEADS